MEYAGVGIGYRERVSQLLAAGDPPEVAHMGMNDAGTYALEGQLADHTELVDEWEEKWSETPEGMRVDLGEGDIYLPMLSNPHTLWYRGDLIDEPPEDWESELDVAAEHDEGEGGTRGAVIALDEGFAAQNKFLSYAWSNDTQVCEVDGEDVQVVMDEEPYIDGWIEVCEHVQELYQYADEGVDIGDEEYIPAVANELSVMNQYVGARPKLAGEDNPEIGANIVPAHPPYNRAEQLYGNIQGHAVFADSNVEAGMEFLRFMSEPQNLMGFYFADPIHNAPIHEAVQDHERYQEGLDTLEEESEIWEIPEHLNFDWIPNGIDTANESGEINPYAGAINNSFEIFGIQYDVLVNDVDPEEAITQRAANLQDLIDDGGGDGED